MSARWHVIDTETDTSVRAFPTEDGANGHCRALNLAAGPGGRYSIRGYDNGVDDDPAVVTLTADACGRLNRLSRSCEALRGAARELAARADRILGQAEEGQHLDGFATDVLGQCGREVQHHASQRAVLIESCLGLPDLAILAALTEPGRMAGSGRWFTETEMWSTESVTP